MIYFMHTFDILSNLFKLLATENNNNEVYCINLTDGHLIIMTQTILLSFILFVPIFIVYSFLYFSAKSSIDVQKIENFL